MATFLFSALFADTSRQNRLQYLEQVLESCDHSTRFVAFNLSLQVSSGIDVVNAEDYATQVPGNFLGDLRALMAEISPDRAAELWRQAEGELDSTGPRFKALMKSLHRNIIAFIDAIEKYRPDYVYLWNQFNIFHTIAAELLKKQGIKFGFFHEGLLPGSIAFDIDGEMGESWVSRRNDIFSKIKITREDQDRASGYYGHLVEATATRHLQRASIDYSEALRHVGLGGRPMIFYAGQNDWYAGIKPDGAKRAYHSPGFMGSLEALYALDKVATKLGLAVLFKPHPFSRERYAFLNAADFRSSLVLHSIDLNSAIRHAAVFSTIASQSAYSALCAGKPVMMLGRNQITGKNLTYDVAGVADLSSALKTALKDPLGGDRRAQIIDHIARLEKAYLFDFGSGSFFRRGPDEAGRFMHLSLRYEPEQLIEMLVSG